VLRPTMDGRAAKPVTAVDPLTPRLLDASRSALAAWGRFAVSGSLDEVGRVFDQSGPQFERLTAESRGITAHPPGAPAYTFTLTSGTVLRSARADERIVRADVVVSRPNEEEQQFGWDLVMRRGTEDRWLLWTVRDGGKASSKVGVPSPGGATS
jgi:hypothetical protein